MRHRRIQYTHPSKLRTLPVDVTLWQGCFSTRVFQGLLPLEGERVGMSSSVCGTKHKSAVHYTTVLPEYCTVLNSKVH